jgi:hypothetical protein
MEELREYSGFGREGEGAETEDPNAESNYPPTELSLDEFWPSAAEGGGCALTSNLIEGKNAHWMEQAAHLATTT